MSSAPTQPCSLNRQTRGFGVVELIVVLAAISLLIAFATVILRQVRRQAVHAAAASGIGQAYLGLSLYLGDNQMRFPFYGVPGDPSAPLVIGGVELPNGGTGSGLFFNRHDVYWASAVQSYFPGHNELTDGAMLTDHGYRFGASSGRIMACRFQMTATAFAVPEFWRMPTGADDYSLIRGTRFTHMINPARKGVLLDTFSNAFASIESWKTDKVLVAFGDGSARAEPMHHQADHVDPPFFFMGNGWPIMQTANGLAGVDF